MSWYFKTYMPPGVSLIIDWVYPFHCNKTYPANMRILSLIKENLSPLCQHCDEEIPEEIIIQYKLLNEGLNKR